MCVPVHSERQSAFMLPFGIFKGIPAGFPQVVRDAFSNFAVPQVALVCESTEDSVVPFPRQP